MADGEGWLYELELGETARFRARGLDSAARVAGRVKEAVAAALEADPDVLQIEDQMWLRAQPQHCDRTAMCRGNLHYDVELAVGQVWRHKREGWRKVTLRSLRPEEWGGGAFVDRNTSRRKQAISEKTLRRDYYLT